MWSNIRAFFKHERKYEYDVSLSITLFRQISICSSQITVFIDCFLSKDLSQKDKKIELAN